MITSMLTSKARTTVTQAVRLALGLRSGDAIAYTIEDGRVVLTRFDGTAVADCLAAVFSGL
jgi:antitoxin PrlF